MPVFPTAQPTDADLLVARNFVGTTLSSGVDAVVTTIPVASVAGMVVNQALVIESEIVRVTSVGANSVTVVRGVDGSTAAPHTAGKAVAGNAIAAHHNASREEIIALAAKLTEANNIAAAGIAQLFALLNDPINMGAATAATLVALNNATAAAIVELVALIGMIPRGLWSVVTNGAGEVQFLNAMRINGRLLAAAPNSAPDDATIPNGFVAIWLNESSGALTFRIRNSSGTLSTKTL